MYRFGDVLIINFPYSNGLGSKRRPVIVIKDTNDNDILIAKVTSQQYKTEFDVPIIEWQKVMLLSPSIIRVHKIQTLHSSLVFGHLGRLTNKDLKEVKEALANLIFCL